MSSLGGNDGTKFKYCSVKGSGRLRGIQRTLERPKVFKKVFLISNEFMKTNQYLSSHHIKTVEFRK